MTVPMAVEVRFQKWDQILVMPQPNAGHEDHDRLLAFCPRHGAGRQRQSWLKPRPNTQIVREAADKTPPDQVFAMPVNNKAKDVLTIASERARGKDRCWRNMIPASAIAMLRHAMAIQDSLKYDEPPDWFYPVRESLGAVLLLNGNAAEAEKVFREDLDRNPRNPRSLFGLSEALRAQNRAYDAQFVDKQFQSNWKGTDIKLKVADLT